MSFRKAIGRKSYEDIIVTLKNIILRRFDSSNLILGTSREDLRMIAELLGTLAL